jgi:hypothetical protein
MRCGDMEDAGFEGGDEECSVEDGGGKELTAEEEAAAEQAAAKLAEEARQAKKAWERELNRKRQARYRERHPKEVKERNDAHYQDNKWAIRARQNERNAQLRLARDGAGGAAGEAGTAAGGPHFGVLPGCRGVCNPAMCAACLAALRAGRHPVRQRVNEAYVIAAQEEKALPVDAQEEAAFRARAAMTLCEEGCRVLETDLRAPTCRFWGECRRCKAVKHRQRDFEAAQGAFYAAHREEVDESHRQADRAWMEWVNSWSAGFGSGPQAGAARRAAIELELAALITARS